LIFSDAFDDAQSGWGTGSTAGGDVQYVDSAIQFTTVAGGNWVWSYRPLQVEQNVIRTEATFVPSTTGYQGLLCGNSEDPLYGAVVSAEGRWVFVTLAGDRAQVLTTAPDVAWTVEANRPTRMVLDCAGTASGGFRMQLSLPDVNLAARYDGGQVGPESFDRVGIYAEASADAFTLRVDDVSAFGG
jgi:hypothetical protein